MSNITKLVNELTRARVAYYRGGDSIMEDAQYDALEEQLRAIDPNHPILKQVGSPVPRDGILTKVRHAPYARMGSLLKVNTDIELEDWAGSLGTGGNGPYHVSYKGDGASMALYYEDGVLVQAVSRGDGEEGEDVTANALLMRNVPRILNHDFTGAIRCEVILRVEDWKVIDPDLTTNPRNVGNGIMGRKNGHQSEYLTVLAFDLDAAIPDDPTWTPATETAKFAILKKLGLAPMPNQTCATLDEVKGVFKYLTEIREKAGFWIDGMVVRHDSLAVQAEAGFRDGRPKGQRAWKFDAEGATTVLRSVELTVGHTGAIIPTGILEPVMIGGTTISRVLLNNWDEIARLGVQVGDSIRVIKANDIIPKVASLVTPGSSFRQPIMEPEKCPCCGGVTARTTNVGGDTGVMTVCTNVDGCPAQAVGKVKRWVKSLNILGMGDSLLEALFEANLVTNPTDLYRIKVSDIENVVINAEKGIRLGNSRAVAFIEEINKSRDITVGDLMGSLGIKFLGKRRAELMIGLAPELGVSLDPWLDGSLAGSLAERAGVPEMGREIDAGIRKERPIIEWLRDNLRVVMAPAEVPVTHASPEGGKKVCISGKLPSGRTKSYYAEPLARHGHVLVDSVNGTTDILVLADPASESSKAQKARKMGITIIGETALEAMI